MLPLANHLSIVQGLQSADASSSMLHVDHLEAQFCMVSKSIACLRSTSAGFSGHFGTHLRPELRLLAGYCRPGCWPVLTGWTAWRFQSSQRWWPASRRLLSFILAAPRFYTLRTGFGHLCIGWSSGRQGFTVCSSHCATHMQCTFPKRPCLKPRLQQSLALLQWKGQVCAVMYLACHAWWWSLLPEERWGGCRQARARRQSFLQAGGGLQQQSQPGWEL